MLNFGYLNLIISTKRTYSIYLFVKYIHQVQSNVPKDVYFLWESSHLTFLFEESSHINANFISYCNNQSLWYNSTTLFSMMRRRVVLVAMLSLLERMEYSRIGLNNLSLTLRSIQKNAGHCKIMLPQRNKPTTAHHH